MPKNKHKVDYFEAFKQMTDFAVQESDLLIGALTNFTEASNLVETMRDMHDIEHKGDDLDHDIFSQIATDFMTPIDRQDITILAQALDTIIDNIEDVVTHMYMYDVHVIPEGALRFAELIKHSCETLDSAMIDFPNFKKPKKFEKTIVSINTYEEESDSLYQRLLRDLHTEHREEVMHVLVWSRLYERMEACCNSCETASNLAMTVLLKNV